MPSTAPDTLAISNSLETPSSDSAISSTSHQSTSQDVSSSTSYVDLSVYQKPRVNIENMPHEIFVKIFQWLDIRSLDAASLVSKKWHTRVANDSVWRAVFETTYGTTLFSRVSNSLSWKNEVIERHGDLRKWRRVAGATHISYRLRLAPASHISMDFPSMRMIAFSKISDQGIISDPSKGSFAVPHLNTNGLARNQNMTQSVSVSKFGLVYGFSTGAVSGVFLQKSATVRPFVVYEGLHFGKVTATWISKEISPRTSAPANTTISVVTGGEDGRVLIWDSIKGDLIHEFMIGTTEFPEVIRYIDSDSQHRIIIGTAIGNVYLWNRIENQADGKLILIGKAESQSSFYSFACDFAGGYAISTDGPRLMRHRITDKPSEIQSVVFEMPLNHQEDEITKIALDNSPFAYVNENSLPKLVPGEVGKFMIAISDGLHAYVWNIRAPANLCGQIPLIHAVPSPYALLSLPNIIAVAINPVVFAVCSVLGVVYIFDVLTGKRIQLGTVRFPRNILNYDELNQLPQDDTSPYFFNVFHLELDPNPENPQGIVVVNSAVQYFEFGVSKKASKVKARGIKKKIPLNRHTGGQGTPRNEELLKEIDDDYHVMKEVSREIAHEQRQRAPYVAEGLTEEEQLSYAMLLSQEVSSTSKPDGNIDKDMEEAIKLSLQDQGTEDCTSSSHINESIDTYSRISHSERPADVSEQDWNLVMQMSMQDNHFVSFNDNDKQQYAPDESIGSSSMHMPEPEISTDISEEDWQIIRAMELSMNPSQAQSSQTQSSEDADLELALKLSLLDSK